jgi:hypothetical protein
MAYGPARALENEIARLAPNTGDYCGGRVNCVCPGWTVLPRTAGKLRDAAKLRGEGEIPPLQSDAGFRFVERNQHRRERATVCPGAMSRRTRCWVKFSRDSERRMLTLVHSNNGGRGRVTLCQ